MKKLFILAACISLATWTPAVAETYSESNGPDASAIVKIVCGLLDDGRPVPYSLGSGVVVDDDVVLTNAHVAIHQATDWCVGGLTTDPAIEPVFSFLLYPTTYVSSHEENAQFDYAFMRAYDENAAPYAFSSYARAADTMTLAVNDAVTLFGYPRIKGETITRTEGVVTAAWPPWIMSDAEAHPGNSGGGAFNAGGDLIGLPTMITATGDTVYIQDIDAIYTHAFGESANLPEELTMETVVTTDIVSEDAVALTVDITPSPELLPQEVPDQRDQQPLRSHTLYAHSRADR